MKFFDRGHTPETNQEHWINILAQNAIAELEAFLANPKFHQFKSTKKEPQVNSIEDLYEFALLPFNKKRRKRAFDGFLFGRFIWPPLFELMESKQANDPEAYKILEDIALGYTGDSIYRDLEYKIIEHFESNQEADSIASIKEKVRTDKSRLTGVLAKIPQIIRLAVEAKD